MPTGHHSGTVYIWYPHGGQVGHASMHIGAHTERNDTEWYVSWWPEGNSVFNESRSCNTLSGDWSGEGGLPHVVYKVYGGDIDVMKTVWDASRNKPAAHYDMFKKNCSTLVARILNAGGHKRDMGKWARFTLAHQTIWTPAAVARYCNELRDAGVAEKTKAAGCPTKGKKWGYAVIGMR